MPTQMIQQLPYAFLFYLTVQRKRSILRKAKENFHKFRNGIAEKFQNGGKNEEKYDSESCTGEGN